MNKKQWKIVYLVTHRIAHTIAFAVFVLIVIFGLMYLVDGA